MVLLLEASLARHHHRHRHRHPLHVPRLGSSARASRRSAPHFSQRRSTPKPQVFFHFIRPSYDANDSTVPSSHHEVHSPSTSRRDGSLHPRAPANPSLLPSSALKPIRPDCRDELSSALAGTSAVLLENPCDESISRDPLSDTHPRMSAFKPDNAHSAYVSNKATTAACAGFKGTCSGLKLRVPLAACC